MGLRAFHTVLWYRCHNINSSFLNVPPVPNSSQLEPSLHSVTAAVLVTFSLNTMCPLVSADNPHELAKSALYKIRHSRLHADIRSPYMVCRGPSTEAVSLSPLLTMP